METPNSPKKSFVTANHSVMITCPKCDFSKLIKVALFSQRKYLVKIKCKCGHSFKMHLEFRRYFRKKTEFEGMYHLGNTATNSRKVAIVDLSLGGACLEFTGAHAFKIGGHGTLRFVLDNEKEAFLAKQVVIKSVSNNRMRCQFTDDKDFEKELGFYLLR